jgi:serine/threonine protein kinase/ankyrin repeat protein
MKKEHKSDDKGFLNRLKILFNPNRYSRSSAKSLPVKLLPTQPDFKVKNLPFHKAIIEGEKEIIESFLRAGVDVNEKGSDGITAFHIAISVAAPKKEIIRLLCEHGANVNLKSDNGTTALRVLVEARNIELIQFLFDKGLVIDLSDKHKGDTVIHSAIKAGELDIAKFLIDRIDSADANVCDDNKKTPLILVSDFDNIDTSQNSKRILIASTLLKKNARHDLKDNNGRTALHYAAMGEKTEIVKVLISQDQNLDERDRVRRTPLMWAARSDASEVVEILLQKKANISLIDKDEKTALQIAMKKNSLRAVKILIKWHATPTSSDLESMDDGDCKDYIRGVLERTIIPDRIGSVNAYACLTLSLRVEMSTDFNYKAKDKLGEGTYGVVYHGICKIFNQVAIKKLHQEQFDEKIREEFLQEASVMASASVFSDYLVRLQGICLQPPHLIMEYMPGGNLFYFLQKTKDDNSLLFWLIKCHIAYGVAAGLYHLHQSVPPILHRDLKSPNILLKPVYDPDLKMIFYHPKLCDFGLSRTKKTLKGDSSDQNLVGTVPWMAPELFRVSDGHNEQSDIFSLGLVIWELATHKTPYQEIRKNIERMIRSKDVYEFLENEKKNENIGQTFVATVLSALRKGELKNLDSQQKLVVSAFEEIVMVKLRKEIEKLFFSQPNLSILERPDFKIDRETPDEIKKIIEKCCDFKPGNRPTAKSVTEKLLKLTKKIPVQIFKDKLEKLIIEGYQFLIERFPLHISMQFIYSRTISAALNGKKINDLVNSLIFALSTKDIKNDQYIPIPF